MTYTTFNFPGAIPGSKTLLTGIRRKKSNLYISGFYVPSSDANTVSFLYKGLATGTNGGYYLLNYPHAKATNLYGPNVLDHGRIRVVGNFTTDLDNNTHGCMYEGHLNGKGKWTRIVPTSNTLNTICHSTMGKLVVGNYDTILIAGKAFIYDIKKQHYTDIIIPNAKSVTAYGVWYNGDNRYTICGGYSPIVGSQADVGYIVDYDRKTKKFSNMINYYYNNDPVNSTVTHFDGITGTKHGYNLTGVAVNSESVYGFFASVSRKNICEISLPKWSEVSYPGSDLTTGNSVVDDTVIGIYTVPDDLTINGYIRKL